MSFDPIASRLVLLSQLESLDRGSKVRFLGCVQFYDVDRGQLHVKDSSSGIDQTDLQIVIDLRNVLETITHEQLEVGAWVNTIGYVQHRKKSRRVTASNEDGRISRQSVKRIEINAIMIWDAGAIRLDAYNSAVLGLQNTINERTQ